MAYAKNRRNPYIIGRAIDERQKFFGRESLFAFIEDNLRQQVKVVILHGQRRIGKSSVLKQIPNKIFDKKFVFVPFDLQDKSQSTLSQILHTLAIGIVEYLNLQDRVKLPTVKELEADSDIFSRNFLPKVYQEFGGKHLVLLLDEFDVLSYGNANIIEPGSGFFFYLKRLLKQQENLFVIPVVGRNPNDLPNLLKLFREAPFQEIGLLDELSAKRLITRPAQGLLEYDQEAIRAILELSSGHPYFTQVICFTLFSRARELDNKKVNGEDVESIVDQAIKNAEGGLAWFWDRQSIPEQVVLSAVAKAQSIAISNAQRVPEEPLTLLESYGVIRTENLIQAAERLVRQDLLDDIGRRMKIELVRRWLVQRHPVWEEIWELEKLGEEAINRLEEVATSLHKRGKNQTALAIYEQILVLNPNHFRTIEALAKGYLEVENFDKAIELYRRIYQVDPVSKKEGFVLALEAYGYKLITQQEFSQAREQYNQVLEIAPDKRLAQQRLQEINAYEQQRLQKRKAYEQQRLQEINTYESGALTWICKGYRDIPHQPVTFGKDQICPRCSRSLTSSNYSSQYRRKLLLNIMTEVAGIALVGFGTYRVSTPCPVGMQKAWAILCVADQGQSADQSKISRGERTLFPSNKNPNRDQGIEAFKKGDYSKAVQFFRNAVVDSKNDPEVLIYYNNARAKQQGSPLTLATVVTVDKATNTAQEILRGVAQAQNQFNEEGGLNGRLLEIVIVNDGNNLEKVKKVAQELVEDPSVLGVIGHSSSDASRVGLFKYEKAGLAMISPTSTSPLLTSNVFFRTTPSDAGVGKKLAEYSRNKLGLNKVVIFFNPVSLYSNSLREEFTNNFKRLGGKVVRTIDLSDPNLDVELEVPKSLFRDQAQAALLFPDTLHTSVALDFAKANAVLMASPTNRKKLELKLLGGDALYSSTTLTEGGQAVEGLILAIPWFREAPQSKNFAQAAMKQWGGSVSWRTATSFDATQAFIKALSSTNNPLRATVLQGLQQVNLSSNETSGEALQFTPEGERPSEPILVQLVNGQFVLVQQQVDKQK